ncbi:MAG: helix-turn-helix domain-containing protein [Bacteroidota bacterium]
MNIFLSTGKAVSLGVRSQPAAVGTAAHRQVWRRKGGALLLFCLAALALPAQIRLTIASLPANTPESDTLYLTGDFNDWDPAHPNFALARNAKGAFEIALDTVRPPFEYKFTRGSWETVEGDSLGNALNNRRLEALPSERNRPVIAHSVASWEDMPLRQERMWVRIEVEEIPRNTPPDAPIYAVGNFNSWHPGDPKYRLKKLTDSTWTVQVPLYGNILEYKFTRGNWETVEGRSNGRARYNREFRPQPGEQNAVVQTSIETWEDLSGSPINTFTFFWLLAAVVGILLVIAINTLQNNNSAANRVLSVLVLIISLALFGRVAVYDRDIFQAYPKLLLVPDIIYFLYAPIFLLYIRTLLLPTPAHRRHRIWWHFLPFGLHVLAYLPLILMPAGSFIFRNTDQDLHPWFVLSGGIALVYNLGYWGYLRRLIRAFQRDSEENFAFEQNLSFLNTVMVLKAVCLGLWLLAYLIGGLDQLVERDLGGITDRLTDVLFIAFSLTVFCLGYFAMREPEIFQVPPLSEDAAESAPESLPDPESTDFGREMNQIRQLMEAERPWLNPKLSLAELATAADMRLHDLSRVINLGFGMNFNDLVNSYRVEAFKERVLQPEYQQHTFLAIALMVGFNSKTAFNRAFKKHAGMTPRDFLKTEAETKERK